MVYRRMDAGPASQLPAERCGREVGIFCHGCGNIYPQHRSHHRGKPALGKDHVASPCAHEGERFAVGEAWWEPAVEIVPPPREAEG